MMSIFPLLTSSSIQRGCQLQLRLLSAVSDTRRRRLAVAFLSTSTASPSIRQAASATMPMALRSSRLSPPASLASLTSLTPVRLGQPVRWGGDAHHGPRKMVIQPSRHQWDHFWDDTQYYALLGAIPCGLLAIFLYIFVGPAELTEIPEGYEPEEYEYHRHPVTRFFAWFKTHYVVSDQEAYERNLAFNNEDTIRMNIRQEFQHIKNQEALLGDYRGYYFVPVNPRPVSRHHVHRQVDDVAGDLPFGFQSEDPRDLPTDRDAPTEQF